jgi:sterol desaturase/sphingolipid hydroxylase (fatty acid hydroxylase superfamily)
LWLIPLGWFIWSLLEYALHRFFFHWTPHHRRLKKIIRSLHVGHHGDSRNPDKILVRPIYSLTVSALFLAGFSTVTGSFFTASALLTGLWLGFLYYELVHYRLHLSKADSGLLGYQRQGHFYHHFVDPNHCFGVTSPLWDLVFGTYRRVSALRAQKIENRK